MAAAPAQLTPGAVAVISEHADGEGTLKPVLQVMDVRQVTNSRSPAAAERYRMLLSDGVHTLQSMLATAENYRIKERHIVKGSIVNLQEFTCSTIQGRRIIIIIKLDILQSECPIIGSPVPYVSNNIPREQYPNVATTAAQTYSGPNSGAPCALGASVAPRPGQVANNSQPGGGGLYTGSQGIAATPVERTVEPVPNVSYGGSYGTMAAHSGFQGTAAAPVDRTVQPVPNVPYSGSYGSSARTGFQGTVATPVNQTVEPVANVLYGSSYGAMSADTGFRGTPVNHTAEPVPNVSHDDSYGTLSSRSTMNSNMMQPKSQQPVLNTHQNQRFPVPATAGGMGPPGNTHGRPTQPLYQQAASMHINRGPASKNDVTSHVIPLAKLNPYQSKWTIKARVTAKSEIKSYTNARGPGKLFSFDMLDAHGGEIRATCFNAQFDMFYNQIEVGKVYLISRGNLRPVDRRYNFLSHEYEVTLDQNTSIQICSDDNSIPRQQFDFRQISEVENLKEKTPVDLVGVVTAVNPPGLVTLKKDSKERQKRTLQLRDMSGRSVEVTLWGNFCDVEGKQLQKDCDSGLNPILALKTVLVSEFNGRSLNTCSSTQLKVNPEFPEAQKLRQWYATEGRTADYVSLSGGRSSMGSNDVRKTVAQIKDEDLGRNGKPEFIIIKGVISHVYPDNFYYPACTFEVSDGKKCHKKVVNHGDGTWHCERCDKASPSCEFRYILNFQIQDHTGVTYATAFQEVAVDIIRHSAEELATIKEEDEARFAEILHGIRFHLYLFKVKVHEETYNDEPRVKSQIMKAEKLDPLKESGYLLGAIDSMLKEDAGTHPELQAATTYSAGFGNSGQSLPTSNNAYTANTGGSMHGNSSNQFGHQINTHGGLSTPLSATRNVQNCMACGSSGHNAQNCPAAMYRQQPESRPASSYGSSPGDAGYNANMFPGDGAVAQPQPYRNDPAAGGYNRRPHVGATNYY